MKKIKSNIGTKLVCKGWQQEAALRMLCNNLDPEVAENPDNLIVYGGFGKAARNWDEFEMVWNSFSSILDLFEARGFSGA